MTQSSLSIADLAKINPELAEEPSDWDSKTASDEADIFRKIVESALGTVEWFPGLGEATFQMTCSVPTNIKLEQRNQFIGINLSKFQKLFTVTYPWDLRPQNLMKLIDDLQRAGFKYVPFTIFADPETYNWQAEAEFMHKRSTASVWKHELRHKKIWNSLFGYL